MPRGRPKKLLKQTTNKKVAKTKTPPTYDALDFEHTGTCKFNPRNLFEEWGLVNEEKNISIIDKKLNRKNKKATPRRPPVKMINVVCPFCQQKNKLIESEADLYCFTIPNDTSFPTYKCEKCMGN